MTTTVKKVLGFRLGNWGLCDFAQWYTIMWIHAAAASNCQEKKKKRYLVRMLTKEKKRVEHWYLNYGGYHWEKTENKKRRQSWCRTSLQERVDYMANWQKTEYTGLKRQKRNDKVPRSVYQIACSYTLLPCRHIHTHILQPVGWR